MTPQLDTDLVVESSLEGQQRLKEAYANYQAAMMRRDRYEVAAARLQLIRMLIGTGWDAPEEVREQALRDGKVLRRLAELQADPSADLLQPPTDRRVPSPRRHAVTVPGAGDHAARRTEPAA